MLTPRQYQIDAINAVVDYATANFRGRMLVVCPPGGGKTLIGALAMKTLVGDTGLRGLAWAHRRELVGQMVDSLLECGIPNSMIGVAMAGDRRHDKSAPIQVGSIDTIRHRDKPPADFIVSDEAHRDASDGRRKLRCMYPNAFHLGLTATPVRLDGRALNNEYDKMHVAAQPSELIAANYIVAPRIFTVPPELLPDLRSAKRRAGDFREEDLEKAANRQPLVGSIVEHWKRRAEWRRTIVFPVSVRHSIAIVDRFKAAGIPAAHLDGSASYAERESMIDGIRSGTLRILSSCGVLSEGVNLPEVKCIVMARPTLSVTLFIQQAGRCMRPWGNAEPIILDHAGNVLVQRHFAPHADRQWSIHESRGRIGKGAPRMKRCAKCNAVLPFSQRTCECGAAFGTEVDLSEQDAELVEYKREFTEEERRGGLERIQSFAATKGLPSSWVAKVFNAQYGPRPITIGA